MSRPGQPVDKPTGQELRGWTRGDFSLVQGRDEEGNDRLMLRGPMCDAAGGVLCFFVRPVRDGERREIEEFQRRSTQGA